MNNPASTILRDTQPSIRHASDELARGTSMAVDATREYASETLDHAESKVRDLRSSIESAIDLFAAKNQKLARQGLDMAVDAKERAQKQFNRATDATTHYVSEQPLRSVLIAAAVGAGVALLIAALRDNNRNGRISR